jgi:hypothetical protein
VPEHRSIEVRLPNRVIDYADERAAFFFVSNLSSVGSNAYDRWVAGPQNRHDRFTDADIRAINTTMTARTAYVHWEQLTKSDQPLSWLQELGPSWDLFTMDDEAWAAADCQARILGALMAVMGSYRTTATGRGSSGWAGRPGTGRLLRWSGRVSGDGPGGYFCPAADVQLGHHMMQVDFGGLFGDAEHPADLPVGPARGN